ncbi:MAG: hypothetical protein QW595_02515 [Candidatus Bathyarchaeia archaeon]
MAVFVFNNSTAMFIKCQDARYFLKMKGAPILAVFFLMFLAASLLIPSPIFPGNFICTLIGKIADEYQKFVSALINGIFYGAILWLVFVVVSRKFEEEK